MSTTRLTFLYPHLFRSIRIAEPVSQRASIQPRIRHRQCLDSRDFATTRQGRGQRYIQRHGKAIEPNKAEEEGEGEGEGSKSAASKEAQQDTEKTPVTTPDAGENHAQQNRIGTAQPAASSWAPLSEETQAAAILPGDENTPIKHTESTRKNSEAAGGPQPDGKTGGGKPALETVLQMPPPETPEEENASKPPHLQTPPYVHHFDTYTLVQQVEKGGFKTEQSITAMKAVRGLLNVNLGFAKAGLVSKSDVENETYLFRAACSELRTEIANARRANDEAMRRDRTLLQHEVDILNQKLSQELLTLKDDLKGMFDDRKMAVRQEQRTMESAIQGLNNRITVSLNSDSKSEIEGLRWVLTRRSVMGILFMAFMVLTSLRYASYKSHEDEMRKKREAEAKEEMPFKDLPAQEAAGILAAN